MPKQIAICTEDNQRMAEINVDSEQLVHDQDAHDLLTDIAAGTTIVSAAVTSNWEYYAENDQAFIADFGAQFVGGTAEQAFMLLRNPAASGVYVRIKDLVLAVTTNTIGTFKLYRQPTITAPGTALHVGNFRTKTATGQALAYSVPTYSATGNSWAQFDVNAGGVGTVTMDIALALYLLEGDDLLITLAQGSNNNKFSANITWAEEDIPAP